MRASTVAARFFLPSFVVTLVAYARYRCLISPRAEVELSPHLRIGKGTYISSFTKIKTAGGPVEIGERVSISSGCYISTREGGVYIGNDCLLGPGVKILATNHKYDRIDVAIATQGNSSRGIRIGADVWIGAGACVLDGTTIGSGVIVGPNSVASGNIPDNSIVQGNPAKIVFTRR